MSFKFPANAAGSAAAPQSAEMTRCILEQMAGKPTDAVPPDVQQMCSQQTQMLNWQRWSQPYFQGEALCRDRSSNVICLTPQSAQKLRW